MGVLLLVRFRDWCRIVCQGRTWNAVLRVDRQEIVLVCLVALLLEWLVDGKEANRLVDF